MGDLHYGSVFDKEDLEVAFKRLKMASDNGCSDSFFTVAHMYSARYGVERSMEKAYEMFMLLAEKGNSGAQFRIALMYREGDPVERSYPEAFKWFKLSAENGHMNAQFELSRMYRDGVGVEKDVSKRTDGSISTMNRGAMTSCIRSESQAHSFFSLLSLMLDERSMESL